MRKMLLGLVCALAACGDNYDYDMEIDAPPGGADAARPDAVNADAPQGVQILTPTPYVKREDSPFKHLTTWNLEDFEDNALDDLPGTTANGGSVFTNAPFIDSVDVDDGGVDGACPTCASWYLGDGPLRFAFSSSDGLPTHAGVVWTDDGNGVGGSVTFEAFDGEGNSLGTAALPVHSDSNTTGATAEDRFFGVIASAGVGSIQIQNSDGEIEVDHVQWGR